MARMIVGHTTDKSVKIWVRGSSEYPYAFVHVEGINTPEKPEEITLEERHFYTGAVEILKLKANTRYKAVVRFGRKSDTAPVRRIDFGHCTGYFKTFPKPSETAATKFILGSCNLHSLGAISNPDPAFERLSEVAEKSQCDFMIHCGDQIYYDIPWWKKSPDPTEYRQKYLDAWKDSRATRKFLTSLPQYMILDDHEMVDNFTNDMDTREYGATPKQIKFSSLKVYREFVHIRQPSDYGNQALYYAFSHGKNRFFVMDVRSERWSGIEINGRAHRPQMIGDEQMSDFKKWLVENKNMLKFVVTSVPFVAEVDSDDKWCAEPYRDQRNEILKHVVENGVKKLVFLTGDMHNSYHATMELKATGSNYSATIHELMSSPINQIDKTKMDRYDRGVPYKVPKQNPLFTHVTKMKKSEFYNDHSNAMFIEAKGTDVKWKVFRTKKDSAGLSGTFTA